MTHQRTALWLAIAAALSAGCATSSAGNYSITYRSLGAANETGEQNRAAEKAFAAEATSEAEKQAISRVKIFTDTVPAELTLKDNVVALSGTSSAALLGSAEITAVWKAPDDEEVLPALQKAAHAMGANLAFCPTAEKPAGHIWRCYFVKTGAAPVTAPTTNL